MFLPRLRAYYGFMVTGGGEKVNAVYKNYVNLSPYGTAAAIFGQFSIDFFPRMY